MFFMIFTALGTVYCSTAAIIDGINGGDWWPIHVVCAFVCAGCLGEAIARWRR